MKTSYDSCIPDKGISYIPHCETLHKRNSTQCNRTITYSTFRHPCSPVATYYYCPRFSERNKRKYYINIMEYVRQHVMQIIFRRTRHARCLKPLTIKHHVEAELSFRKDCQDCQDCHTKARATDTPATIIAITRWRQLTIIKWLFSQLIPGMKNVSEHDDGARCEFFAAAVCER